MPPLLPEYLSQPVQIVIQSPSTDWFIVLAGGAFTLAGAAFGAWLGARGAYKSTLKANRSIVNQSKLEECLKLIDEMQVIYTPVLRSLGSMPNAHGLVEAKAHVSIINPEAMVDLARRIHTLAKLHALPLLMKAERLVVMSLHARALIEDINARLGGGSENTIHDWRSHSSELAKWAHELCVDMESYIVKNART
ncbi:hypothetical protein [Vreelandella titanicae]|uniref:Transmembrane protein n=1 Tax=Vreelandella titanicae TaxID=664683 RepID=A0A558J6Y9_9GAMM|nr:hypothetical protein [Halomonas titanicae]TVU89407.1 hypothetical protein FQP89_15570 [Halomonas titanicae]